MSYPKWVQVPGESGTTAWCEEDEKKYFSQFEKKDTEDIIKPEVHIDKEYPKKPEHERHPAKKRGRGRPRKGR